MVAFFWEPKTNLIGPPFLSFIYHLIQISPVTDHHRLSGTQKRTFVVQLQRLSEIIFFVNLASN